MSNFFQSLEEGESLDIFCNYESKDELLLLSLDFEKGTKELHKVEIPFPYSDLKR